MIRPACGADNRVPATKLDKFAKCGACKQAMPAVSAPVALGGADDFRGGREARRVSGAMPAAEMERTFALA